MEFSITALSNPFATEQNWTKLEIFNLVHIFTLKKSEQRVGQECTFSELLMITGKKGALPTS